MERDASGDTAQRLSDVTTGANRDQAQAWNGDNGLHWVKQQERREVMFESLTSHLLHAAGISSDSRVLDIGCGCGGTTRAAARQAPDGQVLGVDLSGPMLAEASRLAEAEGIGQARFEQADAQTHPFAAESFDVALSRFGVMFFADPTAGFANIASALRPEGRLAFLCWRTSAENEFVSVPREVLARYAEVRDPGGPGQPGPFSLANPEHTRKLLVDAGFTRIDIMAVDEPMCIGSDVADAMEYQTTTPVTRAMTASMSEEAKAEGIAALQEALSAYHGPDGVVFSGAAWLVTAQRR